VKYKIVRNNVSTAIKPKIGAIVRDIDDVVAMINRIYKQTKIGQMHKSSQPPMAVVKIKDPFKSL
jgi:hypothetical protein